MPLVVLILLLLPGLARAGEPVRHELTVRLSPQAWHLQATDRITLPADLSPGADGMLRFILNSGLTVTGASPVVPVPTARRDGDTGDAITEYAFAPPPGGVLSVTYSGPIHDLPEHGDSGGIIDAKGVVLSGASRWYPQFDDRMVVFSATVDTPEGWHAVSQGRRLDPQPSGGTLTTTWIMDRPQVEIHLVAGPWTEYVLSGGVAPAFAYLREPDPELADRYLTATARYLGKYQQMLGPYPYASFALVENFWETGFGMPSFTLLGPRVIRLPFILDTSYPHEVLHNWWGNGVFVDYEKGNWSEGLTAYLADHQLKAEQGKGAEYRRDALVAYGDLVQTGADFPLVDFATRHDRASQAVGYGKALMFFHMLRVQLGDEVFFGGLKEFFLTRRFTRAGYAELLFAFERVSGRKLGPIFEQWTTRTGAPSLALTDWEVAGSADGTHRIFARLTQTQPETPYTLYVPVEVDTLGGDTVRRVVKTAGREHRFSMTLPGAPTSVRVDPGFDVFRRLDPAEVPPAMSALLGAPKLLILLPGAASDDMLYAYRLLAEAWADGHPDARILLDSELTGRRTGKGAQSMTARTKDLSWLPRDAAVWVLGWENQLAGFAAGEANIQSRDALVSDTGVVLPEGNYPRKDHAMVFAMGNHLWPAPIGWVAADRPEQVSGLARKVPHYTKYGYLVFAGDAPDNRVKGTWPPGDSPLVIDLDP